MFTATCLKELHKRSIPTLAVVICYPNLCYIHTEHVGILSVSKDEDLSPTHGTV